MQESNLPVAAGGLSTAAPGLSCRLSQLQPRAAVHRRGRRCRASVRRRSTLARCGQPAARHASAGVIHLGRARSIASGRNSSNGPVARPRDAFRAWPAIESARDELRAERISSAESSGAAEYAGRRAHRRLRARGPDGRGYRSGARARGSQLRGCPRATASPCGCARVIDATLTQAHSGGRLVRAVPLDIQDRPMCAGLDFNSERDKAAAPP